jgi:hypothetical protein
VGDLAVMCAWRLVDAGAGAQLDLTDVLVLEPHPTAQDVDHLEGELMGVPARFSSLAGNGTDHVRPEGAAAGLADAEVPVSEEGAQALLEVGALGVPDDRP